MLFKETKDYLLNTLRPRSIYAVINITSQFSINSKKVLTNCIENTSKFYEFMAQKTNNSQNRFNNFLSMAIVNGFQHFSEN